MMHRLPIAVVALLLFFVGCMDQAPLVGEPITRVGFLAEMELQHPIISGGVLKTSTGQFYFDLGDEPGSMNQIIVLYSVKMAVPTERGRRIELSGSVEELSFEGGREGKMSYRNEVLTLRSWRYLE